MPYIYSLGNFQTHDHRVRHIMRALFMDFPKDPTVAGIGER